MIKYFCQDIIDKLSIKTINLENNISGVKFNRGLVIAEIIAVTLSGKYICDFVFLAQSRDNKKAMNANDTTLRPFIAGLNNNLTKLVLFKTKVFHAVSGKVTRINLKVIRF